MCILEGVLAVPAEVLSAIHMQGNQCLCLHVAIQKFHYFSHLLIALTFKTLYQFACTSHLRVPLYKSASKGDFFFDLCCWSM